ncbi:DUF4136 domain-containing protein [Candidatus Eisenbacteria bacterium]|uniref:DUF4136 domain-containing protein n=1 Tax=Eiseniibacteriota bacterium TaxID=2212470 RepID=A0ABV6YN47_UNCEI
MRTAVVMALGLILVLMVGCSSLQVSTDYDPNANFGQYKTYGWPGGDRPPDDALAQNPLIAKRIEYSIGEALKAKGYTMLEDGIPDIVIITHAGVQEKMQVTNYSSGYYGGYGGYSGYGMYDPWGYGGGTRTDVSYYDEATLLIDFIDTETKELAWRGIGTKILANTSDPEKVQANVDKVIDKMLASYPPK